MKYVTHAARIILGLLLVMGGATYFLHMMPEQKMDGIAGDFIGALMKSGLFGLVKFIELATGLMFITGFQVPLALLLWFPINIVIVFFSIFLVSFSPIGLVLLAITLYLAYVYKNNFANIFNTNNAWTALD